MAERPVPRDRRARAKVTRRHPHHRPGRRPLQHPAEAVDAAALAVLIGGPLLYLVGNAAYKRVVYGCLPLSQLVGMLALVGLAAFAALASRTDRLMTGAWPQRS